MLSHSEEKPVIWDIQYCGAPEVLRYCKKCGRKREYFCSGEFRVNAQQKTLDIWLIYKCTHCNTTWNSTIYSRVPPQKLGTALLESFYNNDKILAMQYAMDISLIQRNGAEIIIPAYQITGGNVSLEKPASIKIRSQYILPIKIFDILRKKLDLTRRELNHLILNNSIQGSTGQDLRKSKLSSRETIITISKDC